MNAQRIRLTEAESLCSHTLESYTAFRLATQSFGKSGHLFSEGLDGAPGWVDVELALAGRQGTVLGHMQPAHEETKHKVESRRVTTQLTLRSVKHGWNRGGSNTGRTKENHNTGRIEEKHTTMVKA